jgi:hypothetical protein
MKTEHASNEISSLDYYRGLVRSALENGGEYAGHQIPIPWLRMILAGLESRLTDPTSMWEGMDEQDPSEALASRIPPFDVLFPDRADGP